MAICILLLAGASVLVETFQHMEQMNIGFDRNHIVTFTVDPKLKGYTPERTNTLSRQLLDQARNLTGVEAAAIAGRGRCEAPALRQPPEYRESDHPQRFPE